MSEDRGELVPRQDSNNELVGPMPEEVLRDRDRQTDFEKRLGIRRAEKALSPREAVIEDGRRKVDDAAQELLGILSHYRELGKRGTSDYWVRGPEDLDVEENGRLIRGKGIVSEWIHLPQSLSDGSHVVIEFRSKPKKVGGFLGIGRKTPVSDKPVEEKDGIYLIHMTLLPPDEVTPALRQGDLWGAPLNYNPLRMVEEAAEDRDLFYRKVWRIEFGDQHEPTSRASAFKYATEKADPRFRSAYVGWSRLPIVPLRHKVSVDLYQAKVTVKELGFQSPYKSDTTHEYGLDGTQLMRGDEQSRKEGVPYLKLIEDNVKDMQQTLTQAGL